MNQATLDRPVEPFVRPPRAELHEYCQRNGCELKFLHDQSGPPHLPTHTIRCLMDGQEVGRGEASTKSAAEDIAASAALQELRRCAEEGTANMPQSNARVMMNEMVNMKRIQLVPDFKIRGPAHSATHICRARATLPDGTTIERTGTGPTKALASENAYQLILEALGLWNAQ